MVSDKHPSLFVLGSFFHVNRDKFLRGSGGHARMNKPHHQKHRVEIEEIDSSVNLKKTVLTLASMWAIIWQAQAAMVEENSENIDIDTAPDAEASDEPFDLGKHVLNQATESDNDELDRFVLQLVTPRIIDSALKPHIKNQLTHLKTNRMRQILRLDNNVALPDDVINEFMETIVDIGTEGRLGLTDESMEMYNLYHNTLDYSQASDYDKWWAFFFKDRLSKYDQEFLDAVNENDDTKKMELVNKHISNEIFTVLKKMKNKPEFEKLDFMERLDLIFQAPMLRAEFLGDTIDNYVENLIGPIMWSSDFPMESLMLQRVRNNITMSIRKYFDSLKMRILRGSVDDIRFHSELDVLKDILQTSVVGHRTYSYDEVISRLNDKDLPIRHNTRVKLALYNDIDLFLKAEVDKEVLERMGTKKFFLNAMSSEVNKSGWSDLGDVNMALITTKVGEICSAMFHSTTEPELEKLCREQVTVKTVTQIEIREPNQSEFLITGVASFTAGAFISMLTVLYMCTGDKKYKKALEKRLEPESKAIPKSTPVIRKKATATYTVEEERRNVIITMLKEILAKSWEVPRAIKNGGKYLLYKPWFKNFEKRALQVGVLQVTIDAIRNLQGNKDFDHSSFRWNGDLLFDLNKFFNSPMMEVYMEVQKNDKMLPFTIQYMFVKVLWLYIHFKQNVLDKPTDGVKAIIRYITIYVCLNSFDRTKVFDKSVMDNFENITNKLNGYEKDDALLVLHNDFQNQILFTGDRFRPRHVELVEVNFKNFFGNFKLNQTTVNNVFMSCKDVSINSRNEYKHIKFS